MGETLLAVLQKLCSLTQPLPLSSFPQAPPPFFQMQKPEIVSVCLALPSSQEP